MANDVPEEKQDAPPANVTPAKKKKKLTSKQAKLQNSIARLSKPLPCFSYIQTYYLPKKAIKFKTAQ